MQDRSLGTENRESSISLHSSLKMFTACHVDMDIKANHTALGRVRTLFDLVACLSMCLQRGIIGINLKAGACELLRVLPCHRQEHIYF